MTEELTLEDILEIANRVMDNGRCGRDKYTCHGSYGSVNINGKDYTISLIHSYSGPKYSLLVTAGNVELFKRGYISYISSSKEGYETAEKIDTLFRRKAGEQEENEEQEKKHIHESAVSDLKTKLRD